MNIVRMIVTVNTVCIVMFSTGCAETSRQSTGKPLASYPLPQIKKDCDTCHLPAGTHKPGELKKPLSGLCLDCHRDRKAPAEHKVDIVPTMEVKGLPLFDGKIACPTCHDPHTNAHGSMLRMPATDLCRVCHLK